MAGALTKTATGEGGGGRHAAARRFAVSWKSSGQISHPKLKQVNQLLSSESRLPQDALKGLGGQCFFGVDRNSDEPTPGAIKLVMAAFNIYHDKTCSL